MEAQHRREKVDGFDSIKIEAFSPIQDSLNKVKKWVTVWKTLALSKTHRRLVTRKSCESTRKGQASNGKMSKGYEVNKRVTVI